jgi:two-component system, chemotaxis family, sensor kinase Cph1
MKEEKYGHEYQRELRRRAEEKLREILPEYAQKDERLLILLQELHIHQAELEMQNEELRRRQEEIERTQAEYADLYDFAPIGYFSLDRDGRIARANLTAATLLAADRGSLPGRLFNHYVLAGDRETFHLHLREVAGKERRAACELRLVKTTGETIPVLLESMPVRNGEGGFGCRTSVVDLTWRRKKEEELQQALTERAGLNRELEQILYIASHDLQTPLRAITGFLDLLARRYQGRLDAEAHEYISFAVGGARRMNQLLLDLRAFSRLSTRAVPLAFMDSGAALAEALASLRPAIKESGAEITHDQLPPVRGDHAQLVQLFQHLIDNAIKYRQPEEPPRIHVAVEQREHEWLVAVRDNGIGFNPKFADRIFLVFQRLHPVDQYAGTGIGLAICRKIVERHGGGIWAESEPGRGSTFYFTLPKI